MRNSLINNERNKDRLAAGRRVVTKKEDVCNLSHPGWVVCCFQKKSWSSPWKCWLRREIRPALEVIDQFTTFAASRPS